MAVLDSDNTVGVLTVPATTAGGFLVAWALHGRLRGRVVMQMAIFSPYVLPAIATIITWEWIFNTDYGLCNAVLKGLLHLPSVDWLGDPRWILRAMALYAIWQGTGFTMLLYLAGLANVPPDLVEAAKVDGARQLSVARHILIPLVSPTTYLVLVLSAVASFKVFSLSYLLTAGTGGPQLGGLTVGLYLYQQAFVYFHAGYGAAISVAFFCVVAVLTVVGTTAAHRRVHYQ